METSKVQGMETYAITSPRNIGSLISSLVKHIDEGVRPIVPFEDDHKLIAFCFLLLISVLTPENESIWLSLGLHTINRPILDKD
jgi:hypothetical protein